MRILKYSNAAPEETVSEGDLELINQLSNKLLSPEEIFVFKVKLCDNEADRDFDCFPAESLRTLAALLIGKSGIFDHEWSAKAQVARIYRTELIKEEDRIAANGEPYTYLLGYAYMMRTDANRDLIAEIEGGIKKEVSIGCAVKAAICSICGQDIAACGHIKGEQYGEETCIAMLVEPSDAYEWSFVAVPAQKKAGIMKRFGRDAVCMDIGRCLKGRPALLKTFEEIVKNADVGARYVDTLRDEVTRLGRLADRHLGASALESIVAKCSEGELIALKKSFEAKIGEKFPISAQLPFAKEDWDASGRDAEFMI